MADEQTYRWRISRRMYSHLTGTGVWAGEDYSHSRPELSAAGHSLRAKVDTTPTRKDGSTHVNLTGARVKQLRRVT